MKLPLGAPQPLTVSDILESARSRLERHYGGVFVQGEITNLQTASTGHCYFSLKDRNARLSAVLFRSSAARLRFRPEDGMEVVARGTLGIYTTRGQLQLTVSGLQVVGAGDLAVAFEQLKKQLQGEGLFDQSRKRAMPDLPRRVAIITSPTGAAIRDILKVFERRDTRLQALIVPCRVQGRESPNEIATAIRSLHAVNHDLILLSRGGGSLEDLAPFNSESVARALSDTTLPVISAVGHETDLTISDLVADMRAPTPTAGAEVIADQHQTASDRLDTLYRRSWEVVLQSITNGQLALERIMDGSSRTITSFTQESRRELDRLRHRGEIAALNSLESRRLSLNDIEKRLAQRNVAARLQSDRESLRGLNALLGERAQTLVSARRASLAKTAAGLDALSPLSVLDRGYAIATHQGMALRDAGAVEVGTGIDLRLAKGSLRCDVTGKAT